jgi:hypothetical protein
MRALVVERRQRSSGVNESSREGQGKQVRHRRVVRQVGLALLAAGALHPLVGCGDESDETQPAPPRAEQPAPGVGAPSGGSPDRFPSELPSPDAPRLGPSASGEGAGNADFVGDAPGGDPAVLSPDQSCAAQAVQAETIERVVEIPVQEEVVVPSVFYLMMDSSGSMVSDPFTLEGLIEDILDFFGLGQSPPAPTKWDYAVEGLATFVNDPASAGLELGLGYFPDVGLCDGSGYDIPAVGLGALPENAAALESSLGARAPAGGTPLEGALRGATDFCLAFNAQNPDASCVAVLITDGAAEECDARTAADLAAIAQNAAAQGVLTYAAGMQGADFAVLDAIGQAGGGDCDPGAPGFACDLTADRDAFVTALSGIRDRTRTRTRIETRIETEVQVLPCEWQIPAPPEGQVFDGGRVNVELTLPNAAGESVPRVAEASGCGDAGGWYYDDVSAPSNILACPSTCDVLQAAPNARVNLLFGCATILR